MSEDFRSLDVHLARAELLAELLRAGPWQNLAFSCLNDIDGEARVADGSQECIELEITDVLGARRHDIRRVQIVEDVCHFADSNPMVSFMSDEALFLSHVRLADGLRPNGRSGDVLELLQGLRENLDRIVAIVCHIRGLCKEGGALAGEKLPFLLVKLLGQLTERNLVVDRPLQECIDAVKAAKHVLPLLFEIDYLILATLYHDRFLIGFNNY